MLGFQLIILSDCNFENLTYRCKFQDGRRYVISECYYLIADYKCLIHQKEFEDEGKGECDLCCMNRGCVKIEPHCWD